VLRGAVWPERMQQTGDRVRLFMTLMFLSGVFYVFDSMGSSSVYDHSSELMFVRVDIFRCE